MWNYYQKCLGMLKELYTILRPHKEIPWIDLHMIT